MRTLKEIKDDFENEHQSHAGGLNLILELLLCDEFAEKIGKAILDTKITAKRLWDTNET